MEIDDDGEEEDMAWAISKAQMASEVTKWNFDAVSYMQ
jgi:hypothetical protein